MYKIPNDLEIVKLKNELISQVCFGLNHIILFFSKGSIQISGSFSVCINGVTFSYLEVYPVNNDFGLLHLLEKRIVNVNIKDERTSLRLEFEGGIILNLKSNELYESFEINFDGRRVII